jgi:SAM-dependent methyltransferase
MPQGAYSILARRTLATSHGRLNDLLRPGMAVLDVGCGTGAITVGISEVVGSQGRVVGVDADKSLIAIARHSHRRDGLTFEVRDAYDLGFTGEFDVVTSSRVLQWLARPRDALGAMIAACRPGGLVLVLDYNHEKVRFEPPAPPTAARFYDAFLKWRSGAGISNVIADLLGDRFREAGLGSVAVTPQHEVTSRGDGDFDEQILLWAKVAASRGVQMVADGYLTEAERALAEKQFRQWTADSAIHQRLYLLGIEGLVPQAAEMRPWWPKLRLLRSAHAR